MMPNIADIAETLGLPVFPCNGHKKPVVKDGFYSATRDVEKIRRAFSNPGAELIGVPTGAVSGLIAIDVDIRETRSGMDWLNANSDALPQTRTHRTRSGGLHLIFRAPTGVEIRNSAGRIAPGVDVRGEGGYIIVPPSPGYAVADPTDPAEMPRWLIRACMKPDPKPMEPAPRPIRPRDGGTPYGLKALAEECAAIRSAPFGQQEVTLNNACLKIGALSAGGEIDENFAKAELRAAARSMPSEGGREPWRASEVDAKVDRAFADGMRSPRQAQNASAPPRSSAAPAPVEERQEASRQPQQGEHPPSDALPLVWFDAIEPTLDANDFVQSTLTEQGMAVVYGKSNAGKTFLTTDLALHVAAGEKWFGRRVERGGVVYCVLEGGMGFRNRVSAWKAERGLDDAQIPFVAIPSSLNLLHPDADTPRLIQAIGAAQAMMDVPIKLVVIDTLSRALSGGNENASEDMGALVINADKIRQASGAAILFVHHCGKDEARGARGHSLLQAAVDTEIEVVADDASGIKTATVVKQRELSKGATFNFTLKIVELGQNRHGEAVTTCVVQSDEGQVGPQPRAIKLRGHEKRAFEVLQTVLAGAGRSGDAGVPSGCLSVPEKWWRDRFYDSAMAGAEQKAKEKAFRRSADSLVANHVVGMASGRVWIVGRSQEKAPEKDGEKDGEDKK